MKVSDAFILSEPVDFDDYLDYPTIVPYPCSLSLLRDRISSHFYRRVAAFRDHVKLLLLDAQLYNEPESYIIKIADALVNAVEQFLDGTEIHYLNELIQFR